MTASGLHPVRLLIVDDSPLIRAGLRMVLEAYPEVAIVGDAGTAAEGLAAVLRHRPDVVLLDLRLPDQPGLAVCREIRQRRVAHRLVLLPVREAHERPEPLGQHREPHLGRGQVAGCEHIGM